MPARVLGWTVALVAGAAILAPSAGAASTGALTATLVPAERQPVGGMIHLYFSDASADRPGLRALLSGLPPGAEVEIRGLHHFGGCAGTLWTGTADEDGVVHVGITRPQVVKKGGLDYTICTLLGVSYDGGGTGTHHVSAPAEPVRPRWPGTRPEVLLSTLHGTSGDGQHFAAMLRLDVEITGAARLSSIVNIARGTRDVWAAIDGPSPLLLDVVIAPGVASGREILVDDTWWGLVARNETELVLVDDTATALASTGGVKLGKLLGVTP